MHNGPRLDIDIAKRLGMTSSCSPSSSEVFAKLEGFDAGALKGALKFGIEAIQGYYANVATIGDVQLNTGLRTLEALSSLPRRVFRDDALSLTRGEYPFKDMPIATVLTEAMDRDVTTVVNCVTAINALDKVVRLNHTDNRAYGDINKGEVSRGDRRTLNTAITADRAQKQVTSAMFDALANLTTAMGD